MSTTPIRVAVTGAAGQIGYSLLFRIASGAMFGPSQPVILHLIEIEPALPALNGVVMELDDCAFPLLKGVVPTANLDEGFRGVNWALLVGSVPRKAGMERKGSAGHQRQNFHRPGPGHSEARRRRCSHSRRGKPVQYELSHRHEQRAGTLARPLLRHDPTGRKSREIAARQKAGVEITAVTNLAIWGNHSSTQFPDFFNARINGKSAAQAITTNRWLKGEFITTVQQRGAAIIKARGASSAASAANAVVDSVRSIRRADARQRLAQRLCLLRWQLRDRERFDLLVPGPERRPKAGNRAGRACQRISAAPKSTPR